jgi:hypothetical protein
MAPYNRVYRMLSKEFWTRERAVSYNWYEALGCLGSARLKRETNLRSESAR